ncbi:FAD-dependent oxidoreductase [bacterium]|nr:FAD-dependent oxidoreductase [bacterium]
MPDIAIIGGGVAGLAAAFTAANEGASVTLYEAAPFLGGRGACGPQGDAGRHLVTTAYTAFLRLLENLGSRDALQLQPLSLGVLAGHRRLWWHLCHPVFGGSAAGIQFMASPMISLPQRIPAAISLVHALSTAPREPAPDDLIDANGSRGFATTGERSLPDLFRQTRRPGTLQRRLGLVSARSMCNLPGEEVAADVFLTALWRIIDDKQKLAGWARGDLAGLLTAPAPAALEKAGIRLRMPEPVVSVRRTRCGWNLKTPNGNDNYDIVICTLPPWSLRPLEQIGELAPLLQAAGEMESRRIVTLRAHYQRVETLPGPLGEEEGEQGVWFSESQPDGSFRVEYVLSGLDSTELIDKEALLKKFHARAQSLLHAEGRIGAPDVRNYPRATVSLKPGVKRPRLFQTRGFYYAGEWSATGLPCTLEAASLAGETAGRAAALAEVICS